MSATMHRVAFPSMGKEYRLEHGSFEDSVIRYSPRSRVQFVA